MNKLLLVSCAIGAVAVVAGATQETPSSASQTFEVASVKPNKSGERGGGIRRLPGGRVTVTNMAPRILITFAYQLAQFQLLGGPAWLDNDKFDMVAKLEGNPEFGIPGSGPDPIQLAMRALLADRFKLKTHRETREMDIYALVMLKPGIPGPALKPSTTDCKAMADAARRGAAPPPGPPPATGPVPCSILGSPGMIRFSGLPLSQVVSLLGGLSGRMVVDRTGLAGNWEFTLTFAAEQRGQPPPGVEPPAPDPDAPSLFTAIQEQLGLKLESTKGPVDVLVIDSVEQPTPD
jgi:uncharacterized protein (TIGR03435 family)